MLNKLHIMCASPYNNSPSSSTSSAIFSGNSLYSITDGTPFILQKTPTFSFGLAFATDFEAASCFSSIVRPTKIGSTMFKIVLSTEPINIHLMPFCFISSIIPFLAIAPYIQPFPSAASLIE